MVAVSSVDEPIRVDCGTVFKRLGYLLESPPKRMSDNP
jgi:hypothetical protein